MQIHKDFAVIYPGSVGILSEWKNYSHKILNFLKTNIKDKPTLNTLIEIKENDDCNIGREVKKK